MGVWGVVAAVLLAGGAGGVTGLGAAVTGTGCVTGAVATFAIITLA